MLLMVYQVLNICAMLKYPQYGLKSHQIDESLIDPTLKEVWVVYGPGLPEVNGTYEYQKDHKKATAEKFCQLVNNLTLQGGEWAKDSMKQALGIE
jgi:hypothetical protein